MFVVAGLRAVCREMKSLWHRAYRAERDPPAILRGGFADIWIVGEDAHVGKLFGAGGNFAADAAEVRSSRGFLPRTSVPERIFPSDPSRKGCVEFGTWRARARSNAKVCSRR